jgi:hypothetical protein
MTRTSLLLLLMPSLWAVLDVRSADRDAEPPGAIPLFVRDPLPGHSFSAGVEVREGVAPAQRVWRAAIFLDEAGRIRQERMLGEPVATLWDPVAGTFAMVDLDAGEVIATATTRTGRLLYEPAWNAAVFGPDLAGSPAAGDLGFRDIHGEKCHGFQGRLPDGHATYELWWSLDLGLVIDGRRLNARGEEDLRFKVLDLRRGAPDPALFQSVGPREKVGRSALRRWWARLTSPK